jgi:hypothetical protein
MKTTITNSFTGYSATITTKSTPAVSTIKRHIRASKASDCKSATLIHIDGIRHAIIERGNGPELLAVE